jgi:hypothetical protein
VSCLLLEAVIPSCALVSRALSEAERRLHALPSSACFVAQ